MSDVSIAVPRDKLEALLTQGAGRALLPELESARADRAALQAGASTRAVLDATEAFLEDVDSIPQTPYTLYREFRRTGERYSYQNPFNLKRSRLWAAALRVFFGDDSLIDTVHDYTWNICEETNWVIPAHENRTIDLTAVGTGINLAEMLVLIGDAMADEVVQRVRDEIDRRIFQPYLAEDPTLNWFHGTNNWNGVCNGGIGAMFLWLEEDPARLAEGLALVLDGLDIFLRTAFEADGASTEGTGYWQYGLSNFIPFAEMLRLRTDGEIDLLGLDRLADIAAYPLHVVLSPGRYASFSDCAPSISLIPGNLVRLAERTGVEALPSLMAPPAPLSYSAALPLMLRTMLWWDGKRPESLEIEDAVLPAGEVVRFVTEPAGAPPLVLAAKAGHNAENHNQNDVGSFILHQDGEDLLCDPGKGLYSRQYFSPLRYENIFASAYGHSVPVIGGRLQSAGIEFSGDLVEVAPDEKRVVIAFGDAYPVESLDRATRILHLDPEAAPGGSLWVEDAFHFSGEPLPVEEVFVTWADVELDGATATLHGEKADVTMTIEAPMDASFAVKVLEEASLANKKEGILKRLTFEMPAAPKMRARVRVDVLLHP